MHTTSFMPEDPEKHSELQDHHFVKHDDVLQDQNSTEGEHNNQVDKTDGNTETDSEPPRPTKSHHPIFIVVMVSSASQSHLVSPPPTYLLYNHRASPAPARAHSVKRSLRGSTSRTSKATTCTPNQTLRRCQTGSRSRTRTGSRGSSSYVRPPSTPPRGSR